MQRQDALKVALVWSARGLPTFPVAVGWDATKGTTSKRPLTAHGHLDATVDAGDLCRMFEAASPADGEELAVGLFPGGGGHVVLDVDHHPGGPNGYVCADNLGLDGTYTVDTPSGGAHHYYTRPDELRIGAQSPWAEHGVDVRGDRGWTVAPGVVTTWGSWAERDDWQAVEALPDELLGRLAVYRPGDERTTLDSELADKDTLDAPTLRAVEALSAAGGHHCRAYSRSDGVTWATVCRPGKTDGVSATVGYVGPGVINLLSSSWPGLPTGVLKVGLDGTPAPAADVEHAQLDQWTADTTPAHVAPAHAGRLVRGGAYILDVPAEPESIWGDGDNVLWARGEPLLIVGPPGVGKTTLGAQIVGARLGLLGPTLLGYTVHPARRILYLASDRPAQIARAMRRLYTEADRDTLDERLVVWRGPPPVDFGKNPERLLEMCLDADVDAVILDSLKDMTADLIDPTSASNVNRAMQNCVAENVDVAAWHHQRKGQNGQKPKSLEDVFGSVWVTAGQGSVLLLWGAAGDPLVELHHLKQPAAEVGPLKIAHDHFTGRSTVDTKEVDALAVLRNAVDGITTRDLAALVTGKATPSDTDRKKAQRELDRLVRNGLARRTDTSSGGAGGTAPVRYHPTVWTPE